MEDHTTGLIHSVVEEVEDSVASDHREVTETSDPSENQPRLEALPSSGPVKKKSVPLLNTMGTF